MIAEPRPLDQDTLHRLRQDDALVQSYRAFFAHLDWSHLDAPTQMAPKRGPRPHPRSAYVKAFLIAIREGHQHRTDLRRFLVTHPLLVLEIGFRPVTHTPQARTALYGFDVERTVPTARWLRSQLQHFDDALLQGLLTQTVRALKHEIPDLGHTVAFDVKHIYAWVSENNPRVYVKGTFHVTHIPKGDPDCRLGVKKSTNQVQADGSKTVKKESLFGYGSGVAACTHPDYGDIVLAEFTQPFNEGDVTYFQTLYDRTVLALEAYPTNITADAAFDAWAVYQRAAVSGGIAAIALNQHGHPEYERLEDGTPLCPKAWPMHPSYVFQHTRGYRAQRFRCPLLFPQASGACCDHEQFRKGKGCVKDLNLERGGLMRVQLDRKAESYRLIYNQRTSAERINSQAQAKGIERPHVRNGHSVAHLKTLTYIFLNLRTLQKAQSTNA
jgi:hypothetical protein